MAVPDPAVLFTGSPSEVHQLEVAACDIDNSGGFERPPAVAHHSTVCEAENVSPN